MIWVVLVPQTENCTMQTCVGAEESVMIVVVAPGCKDASDMLCVWTVFIAGAILARLTGAAP